MLEVTDPARRLIDAAWRKGRVLALDAPWDSVPSLASTETSWRDASDRLGLAGHIAVSDRIGAVPIYVASDLIPVLRRGLTLVQRRAFGIWPEIAVSGSA